MLPKFVSFAERQSPIVSFAPRQTCSVPIVFWHPSPYIKRQRRREIPPNCFFSPLARVAFTTERGCDGKLFPFTDFGYSINIHIESQALAAFRFGPEFGVHVLQRPRSRPTRPVRSHQPNTIHLLPSYYRFVLRLLAFPEGCRRPRVGEMKSGDDGRS